MIARRWLLQLSTLSPLAAIAGASEDPIDAAMARIRPLFIRKRPSRPGDWLTQHKEAGQTYQQFRSAVTRRAIDLHSTLRIVPIGPLTTGQSAVLDVTKDVMTAFFGLPIEVDPPAELASIPADAQRTLYETGPRQLLTPYLLNDVLMKRRRDADAAVLGITALDLWPGPGWNFVFGQASLRERVGVWSMARNGDPDARPAMRKLCAIRTAMTATHETGHMFGIRHCIAYECGMNGSNNSDERDRQPLEFCPECQAKLWWTLEIDPLKRTRALEAVMRRHEFQRTADILATHAAALSPPEQT